MAANQASHISEMPVLGYYFGSSQFRDGCSNSAKGFPEKNLVIGAPDLTSSYFGDVLLNSAKVSSDFRDDDFRPRKTFSDFRVDLFMSQKAAFDFRDICFSSGDGHLENLIGVSGKENVFPDF